MSPAHVHEPTYAAIKQRLMTGAFSAGFRIEAARLAELLGVSITPVRDALNRLAGERMVDFIAGEGFRVPLLSETELRDLFGLNRLLLLAAIGKTGLPSDTGTNIGDVADRVGRLFLDLAGCSENGEVIATIGALNDRLYRARTLDLQVFADAQSELAALEAMAGNRRDRRIFRDLLVRYHERRRQEAATYARLLNTGEAR